MTNDPKLVVESIIDNNGTKTETNAIQIYPVSITRYAYLEMLDSPFLNPEVKFEVNTVIPTAYVFCTPPQKLRQYTTKDIDKLIADAYEWADSCLTLDDTPELIKNITEQMLKLNKAAPNGTGNSNSEQSGTKKN